MLHLVVVSQGTQRYDQCGRIPQNRIAPAGSLSILTSRQLPKPSAAEHRRKASIMISTKDSDNLGFRIIVVLITLVIAGFFIPQETLSKSALLLLWGLITFTGCLWIQAGLESTSDS
jgi:hypothetical protein